MRYIRLLLLSSLILIIGLVSATSALAEMGTINDNGVNVRSGPGTNYSILKTLTKGTGVTILETRGDWQQIQYGSLKGWVTTRYISTGSLPTSSGKYQLQVTDVVVNLRSGPDTGYSKVGQVHKGNILTVIDVEGNWYRIKTTSGLDAYILSDYVEKCGAVPPEAPLKSALVSPSAPAKPTAATGVNPNQEAQVNKGDIAEKYVNDTKIAADVIRLSRFKDDTGIKISMRSGAELKGEIKEDDGKVIYEFPQKKIEGLFFFEEAIGNGTVKVRGRSEDDMATVEVTFPEKTSYKTSSEDGGKTEVITIVNSIQNINQTKFGESGEKILITTTTPVKYTHRQIDDSIVIDLTNTIQGYADAEYEFDGKIVENLKIEAGEDQKGGACLTIKTSGLGKYACGITNQGTVLNVMVVGKGGIKQRNNNLVILDPGHGGKDTGARGARLNEKDVNLAVALKVGQILEQKGVQVEYTRDTDVFVDLEPRADTANNLNAGLFVSIHSNANSDKTKQGTETYYYAPADNPTLFIMQDERQALATSIHQSLASKIQRPNRGVKTSNFSVLRNTLMPSVLIEIAFISNPDEENLLSSDIFCDQAAQAIAEGILKYMGK